MESVVYIFAVALFVLLPFTIGFWFGKRARVARMHWIGTIVAGEDGSPVVEWRDDLVPLSVSLYVDSTHAMPLR